MDSSSKPSYARDLWDSHGIKMIKERINKTEKSMKSLQTFFNDISSQAFRNSQVYHKLPTYNVSSVEFGTLKFILDRYGELIETMSKNEEILGSKLRTQCYNKLQNEMDIITKINHKLISELKNYNNSLDKEKKILKKAKKVYDEAKKVYLQVERQLKNEKDILNNCKIQPNLSNKINQIENNILSLQTTLKQKKSLSREALESYIKAVSVYRGFRQKYDASTSQILDQLEANDRRRSDLIHSVVTLHLDVQRIMAQQSLKNIETIAQHVSKIDAKSDNMVFVEKYRSNISKPPLPVPKFHPDDDDDNEIIKTPDLEESAEVKFWCEKWKLVIGKLLKRDMINGSNSPRSVNTNDDSKGNSNNNNNNNNGNSNNNSDNNNVNNNDDGYSMIQLSDIEFKTLKSRCIESLNSKHGRYAFSLIINRQRNNEFGLELSRESYLSLVELCNIFYERIHKSNPIDIKPAKLVMIMSQSLYVRKTHVIDLLNDNEINDYEPNNDDNKFNGNNTSKKHGKRNSFLPKKDKLFLADRLKDNIVWKSEKFWKEAYCDSVQQELRKYPKIKRWHSERERVEGDRRSEQIVFSQLAAWTHNMKEFGMAKDKIEEFLDSHDLPKDKLLILKQTLELNINKSNNNNNNNNNDNSIMDELTEANDDNTNDNDTTLSSPKSQGLP